MPFSKETLLELNMNLGYSALKKDNFYGTQFHPEKRVAKLRERRKKFLKPPTFII